MQNQLKGSVNTPRMGCSRGEPAMLKVTVCSHSDYFNCFPTVCIWPWHPQPSHHTEQQTQSIKAWLLLCNSLAQNPHKVLALTCMIPYAMPRPITPAYMSPGCLPCSDPKRHFTHPHIDQDWALERLYPGFWNVLSFKIDMTHLPGQIS